LPVLNIHAEGNGDEANEIVKLNLREKEIGRLDNLSFGFCLSLLHSF